MTTRLSNPLFNIFQKEKLAAEIAVKIVRVKGPLVRELFLVPGLGGFAKKFGLTPEQFGENLRDNYQRHETEQYPMEPGEAAEEHLSSMFPTTETVLEGTRHMVAMQIARDPLVRQCIRQIFSERAKLNITPTKKGKKVVLSSGN